ncbi:MAG TPA: tetratricopeptide repeat protein, partial [Flavobacteriales bacterium]|nr:tetratricopeptide repeat protein [Flavobacteriales bacterium]
MYGNLSRVCSSMNDLDKASSYAVQCMQSAKDAGDTLQTVNAAWALADVETERGHFEEALGYLWEALRLRTSYHETHETDPDFAEFVPELLTHISRTHMSAGSLDSAFIHKRRAMQLDEKLFSRKSVRYSDDLMDLATLYVMSGSEPDSILHMCKEARAWRPTDDPGTPYVLKVFIEPTEALAYAMKGDATSAMKYIHTDTTSFPLDWRSIEAPREALRAMDYEASALQELYRRTRSRPFAQYALALYREMRKGALALADEADPVSLYKGFDTFVAQNNNILDLLGEMAKEGPVDHSLVADLMEERRSLGLRQFAQAVARSPVEDTRAFYHLRDLAQKRNAHLGGSSVQGHADRELLSVQQQIDSLRAVLLD